MFDILRDKLHSFQENLTTALKGFSSASDPLNRKQVITETVPVNLSVGTDVLDKFQTSWSELHELSQENAAKAEDVDGLIWKLQKKVEQQWKDIGQLGDCLASLPQVLNNVGEVSKKMLHLEELFDEVEAALIELEDIMDTRDFQNRQLEQRFQLALYEEKKLASLENVRLKLSDDLAEKVRRHEIRQERLLRECQMASEEYFKEDLKIYKETKTVPKVEFAKSKGTTNNEPESSVLEDIVLDCGDTSALDAFLNDSKGSEVESGKSVGERSNESKNNVLEDVVLDCEDVNASGESLSGSKDSERDELEP